MKEKLMNMLKYGWWLIATIVALVAILTITWIVGIPVILKIVVTIPLLGMLLFGLGWLFLYKGPQ